MKLDVIECDSILKGKEFYKNPLYDKFVEAYSVSDYEVLGNQGWVDIEGIGKTVKYQVYYLKTNTGKEIKCADKHILVRCDNLDFNTKKCDTSEVYMESLNIGDFIMTEDGPEMIMEYEITDDYQHMYDLQLSSESNKLYYTGGILSHNSLWMQNMAVNSADMGYNVLYITLEMSVKKILKRLGSMRLKIPIDDYDEVSMDTDYMKKRIDNLYKNGGVGDGLFENKVGKIYTKFYAAGTSTITDYDQLLDNLVNKQGVKVDMVIVDYIALMTPVKGLGIESNLYQKGKHLAEGLRALAAKYELAVITAVQISKDAWGATDVTLDQIPESKAIVECCDTFFGIIRSETMKKENKYRLKLLKQRDGNFANPLLKFDLNPKYLTIENDEIVQSII